jgi:osmotically-inducible protein OsmY
VKKIISALTFAVALAGLSHAATTAQPLPSKTQVQTQKTTPQTPDGVIEHRIQAKFAKSKINAEHFIVSVHSGVATIDGKTNVIQHKGVATRLAKSSGAIVIRNRIQVSDEARAKAAARLSGNKEDTEIARATVIQPSKSR